MFLASDLDAAIAAQSGAIALVPQIVDAVSIPVIAAGGIADGRGIAAAFALGACGAQIGTAYLLCPEAATPRVASRRLAAGGRATQPCSPMCSPVGPRACCRTGCRASSAR